MIVRCGMSIRCTPLQTIFQVRTIVGRALTIDYDQNNVERECSVRMVRIGWPNGFYLWFTSIRHYGVSLAGATDCAR